MSVIEKCIMDLIIQNCILYSRCTYPEFFFLILDVYIQNSLLCSGCGNAEVYVLIYGCLYPQAK